MSARTQMSTSHNAEVNLSRDLARNVSEGVKEGSIPRGFDVGRGVTDRALAVIAKVMRGLAGASHYKELRCPPIPVGAAVGAGIAGIAAAVGVRSLAAKATQSPSVKSSPEKKDGKVKLG